MIDALIRARHVTFALALAVLGWLLVDGRHVTYEQSIRSFFAPDDPGVVSYQKAAASFGSDNLLFVCYDDPDLLTPAGMDRVRDLAGALGPDRIEGVRSVQSLDAMPVLWRLDDALLALVRLPAFVRGPAIRAVESGLKGQVSVNAEALTIGAAVRAASPELLVALRERIVTHPLFLGTLVDVRGTTTAVVVQLKPTAEHDLKVSVLAIREAADAFARARGLPPPAVVGPPALLADGFIAIEKDGQRLALLGMALIAAVMLLAIRSSWWTAVPLLAGWLVWRATETILAAWDLKLSLSGGPLVAQIIVLTMPAASHLAIHFRDQIRRNADRRDVASGTLRAVAAPILWCAVTGALGYGALLTSHLVPVRQFGAILGTCTLLAALLTLALAPMAMLPPVPLEVPVRPGSRSRVTRGMNRLLLTVTRHAGIVVPVALLVAIPLTAGLFSLEYEPNYINAFKPQSRVVRDYRFAEARLGGIGLVQLVVPLDHEPDAETLEKFRDLDNRVRGIRVGDHPAVGQVVSLATVLDPDGRIAALAEPTRSLAIRTKLDLIAASPQSDLLASFRNPQTGWARVLVRLPESQPTAAKEATFGAAESAARDVFGPDSFLTGLSFLMARTTRAVTATQWSTLAVSAVSILIMLSLALRAPGLAALALLPTALSVGLVLGLMGWLGIKLDLATALVASVALGLSVDDTFHCLLQYRRLRKTEPFARALLSSYRVTGPGVLLSSLAVSVGFFALRFSEFVPFANFGVLIGIATGGSSIGNVVLLPACLALGHRVFGDRRGIRKDSS